MNSFVAISACGAFGLSMLAMIGPPASAPDDAASTATAAGTAAGTATGTAAGTATGTFRFVVARQVDDVQPINGHWEATLPPVGTIDILVTDNVRRVTLNKQVLPPDRVMWQPDNLVMIIDEMRQRQFELALGENGRIEKVKPGSWLEYRGVNAPRVAIGIYTDPISPSLAAQLGLDADAALLVRSVIENLPAFKSGVKPFDVITAVDNFDRVTPEVLKKIVASKAPGQTIQLRLVRRAQPLELSIEVEEVDPLDQWELDPRLGNGSPNLIRIDEKSFRTGSLPSIWTGIQSEHPLIEFENGDGVFVSPKSFLDVTVQRAGAITDSAAAATSTDQMQAVIARLDALSRQVEEMNARLSVLTASRYRVPTGARSEQEN